MLNKWGIKVMIPHFAFKIQPFNLLSLFNPLLKVFLYMFKKNKPTNINLLELTPVRINKHEEVEGLINILIPKFKREFMKKIIPKNKPKDIRVKLDELGSATWLAMDGNKTVFQIVEELRESFGEKIEPAVDRVTKFINGLYANNLLYFKELKKEK